MGYETRFKLTALTSQRDYLKVLAEIDAYTPHKIFLDF